MAQCHYCRRDFSMMGCRNTRDLEEGDRVCYAFLLVMGGGEYIEHQRIALRLEEMFAERHLLLPGVKSSTLQSAGRDAGSKPATALIT